MLGWLFQSSLAAKFIHHSSVIEGNCTTIVTANTNKAAANPSSGMLCQNPSTLKPLYTTSRPTPTCVGKPANHQQILTFFLNQMSLYSPLPACQHALTHWWLYTNICSCSQVRSGSLSACSYFHICRHCDKVSQCNMRPSYLTWKHYSCETIDTRYVKL